MLEALRTVRDPEIPKDLVELGLIYEVMVKKGGVVYVEMMLTTRPVRLPQACPGRWKRRSVTCPEFADVRVKLFWSPPLGARPDER